MLLKSKYCLEVSIANIAATALSAGASHTTECVIYFVRPREDVG